MVKKRLKKKKTEEKETKITEPNKYDFIKDTWNETDYSGFLYSGTATGTTTSTATMTSIFGENSEFYKTWEERMKEKKYCHNCKMYFSSYLKKCPVCGK